MKFLIAILLFTATLAIEHGHDPLTGSYVSPNYEVLSEEGAKQAAKRTTSTILPGTKHLGQRVESSAKDRYLSSTGKARLNARVPDVHYDDVIVRGGSLPSHGIFTFNYGDIADRWRQQHSDDEAYLRLTLGAVTCGAEYEVLKVPNVDSVSQSTWNCYVDEDLRPANLVPNCDERWDGAGGVQYEASTKYIDADDANSIVEIDITKASDGMAKTLLIRRVDRREDPGNSCTKNNGTPKFKDGCSYCQMEILDAEIRIHTYKLDPTVSPRPVPGTTPKPTVHEGVTIDAYERTTDRPLLPGSDRCTVVRGAGVPFTAETTLDAGYISEHCDEIIYSMNCQGDSSCASRINDPLYRGNFARGLIFDTWNKKEGSVILGPAQDQYSAQVGFQLGIAASEDSKEYAAYLGYEDWSANFYCPLEFSLEGSCV